MADDVTSKGQGGRTPTRYTDPFHSFRSEMDRLFDNFLTGLPSLTTLRQGGLPAMERLTMTPTLDVKENEKEIVVKADLPGIDEKDINLTFHDGVLSLRGEKKSERADERENYHLMERSYGSFQRSIRLPETVDEEKVEARFDKGVLTVTLQKRPEMVKAQKKIEIKVS
jgi:HSP20 family protein